MARTKVKTFSDLPSAGSVSRGDLIYVEATGKHYAKNVAGTLEDLGVVSDVFTAQLAAEQLRAQYVETSTFLTAGVSVDTDATMAADDDAVVPSQKAVKTALALKMLLSYLDTNTGLAANSDVKVPSQKAVKAYVDGKSSLFTLAPVGVPATATSSGVAGTWAYDATHIYVCISTNVWVRGSLGTF